MKKCLGCSYAEWDKTKANKLHPSGNGKCKYPYKIPQPPAAFYFLSGLPVPCGGFINRNQEHKDHCPYWQAILVKI
jgi:hypothetical protein